MKIKFLEYITENQANVKLEKIYNHIKNNFGVVAEPFALHSLDAELTGGIWSVMYETVLVETNVKRSTKEAIAVAVSETNKCRYCVDAHSIMIMGDNSKLLSKIQKIEHGILVPKSLNEKIVFWALNSNKFNDITKEIPFSKNQADEIIGTVIFFNYINRMVEVFAGKSPLPTQLFKKFVQKFAKKMYFSKAIFKTKTKGESLQFLNKNGLLKSENMKNEIQKTLFNISFLTEKNIEGLISPELKIVIENESSKIENLQINSFTSNISKFLATVSAEEKPTAEFCYLLMFEPYKIQEKHISNLRNVYNDTEILYIATFSSFAIAQKIGSKLMTFL